MEQFLTVLFSYALAAYIISLGFSMLFARGKGAKWINRQWRAAITWFIRTPIIWLSQALFGVAKKIR